MKFDVQIALLLRIDCSSAHDLRAVSRETANHPTISILISFTSNTKQEIPISHDIYRLEVRERMPWNKYLQHW